MVKNYQSKAIAFALGIALSGVALAEGISQDDYKAGKDRIAAEYMAAKEACVSLAGNPNDICLAQARGGEMIAMAALEANFKPTRENRYQAHVAKAEAEYGVAKERCDDMAGNAKDVCVKEAKAVQTAAKADAKLQLKTSNAAATADEKSAQARRKASEQTADARKDAEADKLDAQYGVAREKCDLYAGGAKDLCLDRAKARFGKS